MMIGYVGPFGDTNFGDYAMLVNDVLDINEKNIKLFTYNEDNTLAICKKYLMNFNFNIIPVLSKNKYEIKFSKDYKIEYNNYPYTPLEIINTITNLEVVTKEVDAIDVLVVIGGGYFNHLWNAKHRQYKLLSIMAVILMASFKGKKVVFLGNTYGPFYESSDMFSIFFSNLKNTIFATRDNVMSPSWFNQLGLKNNLNLLPDDLYFLNKELKADNNSNSKDNRYILLEVYYSINELEQNIDIYYQLVEEVKQKYNYDVVFFPFDKNYGGEIQGEYLRNKITNLHMFKLDESGFLKISDTIEKVKNAELIICNRYHLFVFALANNVPVVQVLKDVLGNKNYYYCKSQGILGQVLDGINYNDLDFFVEDISSAFFKIENDLNSIINTQKNYFNDSKKFENERKLKLTRLKFIEKEILNY